VRAFKLTVAYDGGAFHGWQRQPGQRTVQGVLEEELGVVMGAEIRVQGAGRTDAGCHARGQVASFSAVTTLPAAALRPILDRRLPDDVRVVSAEEAALDFDARRSALGRRYSYHLLDQDDVLMRRMAWHPGRPVDAGRLSRAVRPIEGEHDCAAFQASGSSPTATRCRVWRASWRRWERGAVLDIVADHFLYHMVRNVVGTALLAARDRDPEARFAAVLGSRDRRRAGPTAPPQGLCLEQVFYEGGR
jgi:tRNA pseudouridine38-40 synthase